VDFTAGPDLLAKAQKQIDEAKQVNTRVEKMLAKISNLVDNFKALSDVTKRPEVAVDYHDLDYADKLHFLESVMPPLNHVPTVL